MDILHVTAELSVPHDSLACTPDLASSTSFAKGLSDAQLGCSTPSLLSPATADHHVRVSVVC